MQQASRAKIELTVITSNLQVQYAAVTKVSKFKVVFIQKIYSANKNSLPGGRI